MSTEVFKQKDPNYYALCTARARSHAIIQLVRRIPFVFGHLLKHSSVRKIRTPHSNRGQMQTSLHVALKWIRADSECIRVCKTSRTRLLARKEPQVVRRIDLGSNHLGTRRALPLVVPRDTASSASLGISHRNICIYCYAAHRTVHGKTRVYMVKFFIRP